MLYDMEWSLCSQHCVTRDSSDYLTYKTKQNFNFPFYPFSHRFLRGHYYNYTETVPIGKANHHLFLLIHAND